MQLIAESYAMMKELLGMSHEDIAQTFKDWNAGELESYLIEITGDIFMKLDENKEALVEKILDTAGQKGTGKWTSINALNRYSINNHYRICICTFYLFNKKKHVNASKELNGPKASFDNHKKDF